METYHLPFVLRTPRPVRLVQHNPVPFSVQLYKKLENEMKGSKKRGKKVTGKEHSKLPVTPPSSIKDEEMLKHKRQFILPLIEAKNALKMFKMVEGDL